MNQNDAHVDPDFKKEADKIVDEATKEALYPICPMLSRGAHKHRCINKECVAYSPGKVDIGFCNAMNCEIKVTYIDG